MNRLSLVVAKSCLVYLTGVSALGYVFPVGKVTLVRSVMDAFLLLALVCVFVPKPVFSIIAGVAGVISGVGVLSVLYPLFNVVLSGVGSVTILIGPWRIPGLSGVLLAVIPYVLLFASCILVIFHSERELGGTGTGG
jgi:hypothetical protein